MGAARTGKGPVLSGRRGGEFARENACPFEHTRYDGGLKAAVRRDLRSRKDHCPRQRLERSHDFGPKFYLLVLR